MIRLEASDFDDASWVEKLAQAGNMSAEEFVKRFGHISGKVP
jgi:hypothetical protein